MTEDSLTTYVGVLLTTVAGATAGVTTLVPEGPALDLLVGAVGALLGSAVAWGALRERVRAWDERHARVLEDQKDLWAEINKLKDIDMSHIKEYHSYRGPAK